MNEIEERKKAVFELEESIFTIQKQYFRTRDIEEKISARDIVTKADKEIENLIIEKISKSFPDDNIVGEESGTHKGTNAFA